MGPHEIVVEMKFLSRMLDEGWQSIKGDMAADKYGGNPDRFFFGPGARTIIIEFKREDAPKKRRGEKRQTYVRSLYVALGFACFKVQGMAQARKVFKLLTGKKL